MYFYSTRIVGKFLSQRMAVLLDGFEQDKVGLTVEADKLDVFAFVRSNHHHDAILVQKIKLGSHLISKTLEQNGQHRHELLPDKLDYYPGSKAPQAPQAAYSPFIHLHNT